ncbi:MAG: GNAT family N-acetyltransferase [Roseburia sp.]|nr:GNAT family N-acetyltransferase [Roseburia sp.]
MQICRLYREQLPKALELVWQVFEECDAKDYEEMGRKTFRHFIGQENMEEMMRSGEMVFFGAYESNRLIGVIAMRSGFHISLLFVDKPYQRQGVAKRLVRRAAVYCMENTPELKYITVNSSPAGRAAYAAMGFEALSPEQKKEGMRYTPMRICISHR